MATLDTLAHCSDPQHMHKPSALFCHRRTAVLWFLFMAVAKTGLTAHLGFSGAISCDDMGGSVEVREKSVWGMCWNTLLAHSREGCHHHCNQFRLEKLNPRELHLHRAGTHLTETETVKLNQGLIGKEISTLNSCTLVAWKRISGLD